MWPHEVESWFHSWYIGKVETLDAKYNFYEATLQRECLIHKGMVLFSDANLLSLSLSLSRMVEARRIAVGGYLMLLKKFKVAR